MIPKVSPGCRLMLTGLSPSQVCSCADSSLSAYILVLRCTICWLLMQERLGEEGW